MQNRDVTMKKIIYNIIYSLVLAAVLAAETFLVYRVIKLNMLPDLYLALLILVLLLLAGGIGLLVFMPRKRLGITILRQVIAWILAIATAAGCIFLAPKVHEVEKTVDQIIANEPAGTARNIYVPNNDPAQTIEDASGYLFGAVRSDEYCVAQVEAALNEQLETEITLVYFDNELELGASYCLNEVNALIVSEGQVNVWEEYDNDLYHQFKYKNRSIHTVYVDEDKDTEQVPAEPLPEVEPIEDITNTPFAIYVSGNDSYSQTLTATRSDVNILVIVNPETKQALMINTPRDYYIVHPWGRGGRDKLTHCGIYGIDCSIDAIELLYDLPVNYYVQVNFEGFKTLIDAIGGVEIYSPFAFQADSSTFIPEGNVHMDGKTALAFSRDRKHQPGGDNGRGQNQMKMIQAVINKMLSGNTLIKNYAEILNSLEGMIATDMERENISKLVKMQLMDNAKWEILTYAVTGYDSNNTTYSMPSLSCYVMVPNQKSVDYAKELATRLMNGETLTQEDMTMPK